MKRFKSAQQPQTQLNDIVCSKQLEVPKTKATTLNEKKTKEEKERMSVQNNGSLWLIV